METVKGFRDIENSTKRNSIRNIIEETFKLYNFIPVETPIIEYKEFVKGENSDDEAVSDIFKLQDKGKRNLALRYEFTFQLKRLTKNKKLPYKRYQIGPVFRDEPITKNRWRQFTQCDVDIIGSSLKDEAEILKITSEILKKLRIKFIININNRKMLNEILDEEKIKENFREQILREIDKIDKQSEKETIKQLKKYKAEKIFTILKKPRKYFEKYKNYKEIKELKKLCEDYNIKINFQPSLARGLSYYNRTIFEVKSDLKGTIAGGGSYLINNTQSTGISFGLDRLELLSKIPIENKKILIISLGKDQKAIKIAENIRSEKIPVQISYKKPGKALDYANSLNFPLVIFIGGKEIKEKKLRIKNMKTGKEKNISETQLIKFLKKQVF